MAHIKSKKRFVKSTITKIFAILIVTTAIVFIVSALIHRNIKHTKYIAYIGKSSTTLSKLDNLQESIFIDFISHMNADLSNYKIDFLVYNIGTEPRRSDSIYKVIAKEKNILFVIDNTHGNDILYAQQTIKKNNIPVFFINADKNGRDYGTAAIFTGNGDNFPYELTSFLKNVATVAEVNFISECDYLLQETFFKAFNTNAILVKDTILVERKEETKSEEERVYKILASKYKNNHNKLILVVNTHSHWGDKIINYIEKNFQRVQIIGGEYIAELKGLKRFGAQSHNQLIIAGEPTDALSENLLNQLNYFEKKYPDEFNRANAPYFTKRCFTITEFIETYFKKYDKLKDISRNTAAIFTDLLKNTVLQGKENLYAIDSIGILKRETSFTSYKDGKLYSLPLHINQLGNKIPNIIFGIDIIDIHNVDINENTFAADYFYWIRIDTSFKSKEKDIVFQNIKQDESSKELVMEKVEDNSFYKLFKVSGKFYNDFSLADYPLDKQEIKIQVDILKPVDSIKISFDQRSIEQDPSFVERFNVPGWDKLRSHFTIDNRISKNMRGAFEEDDESPKLYKSLNYRLNLKRKVTKPILEIILPLFFIGISSISLLFVRDLSFSNIGEVSVGILLAIITFSIALAVIIPTSDYLTKADWFFWTTFFEVLFCFITVIYLNYRYAHDKLQYIKLRGLRVALLIIFFLSFATIIIV